MFRSPVFRRPSLARRVLACAAAVCALTGAAPAAHPGSGPGVVIRPATAVRYVALGDSEASAPGVPVEVDPLCRRSDHDYPSLVAARLHPASFSDVTCSGATTADLARRQFPALRPATTLVTLTVGANDIGFGDAIARCTALGVLHPSGAPCRTYYGTVLDRRIARTAPKVADALRTVHRLAPRARVLVVGYLDLVPDDHRGCRPRELFADGDLGWLDRTENALNTMLARTARGGGAVFVDDHPASATHDVCRPTGTRWTEAILPTRPAAPFHPNAAGEAAMARQVLAAVR